MDTNSIMNIALELAGFDYIPGDSEIFYHGENIKKILFGIDIRNEDLINKKGETISVAHHLRLIKELEKFSKEKKDKEKEEENE